MVNFYKNHTSLRTNNLILMKSFAKFDKKKGY